MRAREFAAAMTPSPSPGGGGSACMSAAKCATGWGDVSTRALFDAERPSPHPDCEFHSQSTLPLQGRVKANARRVGAISATAVTSPPQRAGEHLFEDLALDHLVGEGAVLPPPAVLF